MSQSSWKVSKQRGTFLRGRPMAFAKVPGPWGELKISSPAPVWRVGLQHGAGGLWSGVPPEGYRYWRPPSQFISQVFLTPQTEESHNYPARAQLMRSLAWSFEKA
jgi:hypothetical protein